MTTIRETAADNYSRILSTPAIREQRVTDGRWSYATGVLGKAIELLDVAIQNQTGGVVVDDHHRERLDEALGLLDALGRVRAGKRIEKTLSDAEARQLDPGAKLVNRLNRHPLRFLEHTPDGKVHAVDETTDYAVTVDVHEVERAS